MQTPASLLPAPESSDTSPIVIRSFRAQSRVMLVQAVCAAGDQHQGTKLGFFTRQDFLYNAEHDHYTCPA